MGARRSRELTAVSRCVLSHLIPPHPISSHLPPYLPIGVHVYPVTNLFQPGPYEPAASDAWLGVASDAIQNRMGRQNDEFLSFNLLAVCQSPLMTLSRTFATSLSTAHALNSTFGNSLLWNVPAPWTDFPDDRLARFDLTREKILSEFPPDTSRIDGPSGDATTTGARKLAADLRGEQEALEARYVAEVAAVEEAVDMIRARQRDYTPAVHAWVRVLAEKGVLRELIQEMDSLG